MSTLAQEAPIEADNIRQSNSLATKDKITQIIVPAKLIARSLPSGHSVPIIRIRRKLERARPFRNLVVVSLLSLVALFGVGILIYYSVEAERAAGNHLICSAVGVGKGLHTVCHWERLDQPPQSP
jgi:hypothetical protein